MGGVGLFDRLFGAPAGGAVASPWADGSHLQQITLGDLWPGMDPDTMPISRAEAMAVPAVAAVRHRITGTLSRLPIAATKAQQAYTDSIGLLTQPDPGEPHTTTLTKTYDDLLFDGLAWWLVTAAYSLPQPSGATHYRPMDIVHIPVHEVAIDRHGLPQMSARFLDWLRTARRLQPLAMPTDSTRPWLIGFAGPHDGLLSFGARSIRIASRLDRAVANAADNPVPSAELHQVSGDPVTPSQARSMLQSWVENRRRFGVSYTNPGLELKTHGQQAEQLLIDARNQQAIEAARLAGIPASSIDAAPAGSSLTYANLRDRVLDLVNFGLSPYGVALTARLSMDDCLPAGVQATIDYRSLFPADGATPSTQSSEKETS